MCLDFEKEVDGRGADGVLGDHDIIVGDLVVLALRLATLLLGLLHCNELFAIWIDGVQLRHFFDNGQVALLRHENADAFGDLSDNSIILGVFLAVELEFVRVLEGDVGGAQHVLVLQLRAADNGLPRLVELEICIIADLLNGLAAVPADIVTREDAARKMEMQFLENHLLFTGAQKSLDQKPLVDAEKVFVTDIAHDPIIMSIFLIVRQELGQERVAILFFLDLANGLELGHVLTEIRLGRLAS